MFARALVYGEHDFEARHGLRLVGVHHALDDYGDVEIVLWPDWVTKVPTRADRISFSLGDPQPSATP